MVPAGWVEAVGVAPAGRVATGRGVAGWVVAGWVGRVRGGWGEAVGVARGGRVGAGRVVAGWVVAGWVVAMPVPAGGMLRGLSIWSLVESTPLLASWRAATETLNFLAMVVRVS